MNLPRNPEPLSVASYGSELAPPTWARAQRLSLRGEPARTLVSSLPDPSYLSN